MACTGTAKPRPVRTFRHIPTSDTSNVGDPPIVCAEILLAMAKASSGTLSPMSNIPSTASMAMRMAQMTPKLSLTTIQRPPRPGYTAPRGHRG